MSYTVLGDWGTSRLRLFRREADGTISAGREGPGIGALDRAPADVLRALLAEWWAEARPEAIRLCGMVGSRNGWIDVPYVDCPAGVSAWQAGAARLDCDGAPVAVMAGLAGANPQGAPDVMRGEETQIFGALALDPALGRGRHLLALPGTHSKWARIEDSAVTGFHTFLTGESFALYRDHSTLARVPAQAIGGAEEDGFDTGLARAQAGGLLGALFEARARQLREGRSPAWALAFLSGLLIGAEVADALAETGASGVTLIGDPLLCSRYARALAAHGVAAPLLDGDACALAGLALGETA